MLTSRATVFMSFLTSTPGFLVMMGTITIWWSMATSRLLLSGVAALSNWLEIRPPAPGLLSTTTVAPMASASASP